MKPFIVEPDRAGLGAPHWTFYLIGWSLIPLAIMCIISAFFLQEASTPLLMVGILASVIGSSMFSLGRFFRETTAKQDELTRLNAEQTERIRKLEEQVAALTAASSPKHEHAA
jgi:hypothetical protein